jgi:drug/metabolite transporter (DMT)-like permease
MTPSRPPRGPIDRNAALLMLGLCLCWALQQIAVKWAAPDMAPVAQIGWRSAVAAGLVALFMAWRREPLHWRRNGRAGAWVGLLFGVEFLLVAEALVRTSAAHTVVFLYTAPLFAALGLHLRVRAERLRPLQWGGLLLAFAGIALAFGRAPAAGTSLLGDAFALAAGLAWGLTTVGVRGSRLADAAASEVLLYQLVGAALLLLAVGAWTGQMAYRPTPVLAASLAFQAVVVAFVSYLVWFWLLTKVVASALGAFSFLTPVLGVGLGALLLNEPLEPAFLGGSVLVLAGVAVVSLNPAKSEH